MFVITLVRRATSKERWMDTDGNSDLDRQCTTPEAGKYVQSDGTLGDCTPITANGDFIQVDGFPVTSADTCPFACDAGFVKNKKGRTCTLPSLGHYADSDGVEKPCTTFPHRTTTWGATPQEGVAGDSCPFKCVAGYVKIDESDGTRACGPDNDNDDIPGGPDGNDNCPRA